MAITNDKTRELVSKFGKDDKDTGTAPAQIAILTERINNLSTHLQVHIKDHGSRRGLLKLIGQRKRIQAYYQRENPQGYAELIKELGLRR